SPRRVAVTAATSCAASEQPVVRDDVGPAIARALPPPAVMTSRRAEPPLRVFRPIVLAAVLGVFSVVAVRAIGSGARSWLPSSAGLTQRVGAREGDGADLRRRVAKLRRALAAAR